MSTHLDTAEDAVHIGRIDTLSPQRKGCVNNQSIEKNSDHREIRGCATMDA